MADVRTIDVERSTATAHRLVQYDGACGNIHGHNIVWDVSVEVSMEDTGPDNMPIDMKKISDIIDEVDHAIILSGEDPLVEFIQTNHQDANLGNDGELPLDETKEMVENLMGDVIWFEGDPTCEVLSQWMAERIVEADESILWVSVDAAETDKYSVSTDALRQSLKLE